MSIFSKFLHGFADAVTGHGAANPGHADAASEAASAIHAAANTIEANGLPTAPQAVTAILGMFFPTLKPYLPLAANIIGELTHKGAAAASGA